MCTIPRADTVGIQFGLVTSEDAKRWSGGSELGDLCQNVKRNVAAYGTVNSPALGTQNASTLCGRCGGDIEHCTGHFCKLHLFQPICNVNFFPVLPKVYASLCVRCSRVLLPNNHPRLAKSLKRAPNFKRAVHEVFTQATRYRTCWFPDNICDSKTTKAAANKKQLQERLLFQQEEGGDALPPLPEPEEEPHILLAEEAKIRGYCGARQPDMWIRDEDVLIRPTYFITEPDDFDILPKITPRHLYNMLKFASKSAMNIFGFDPIFAPLHGMMVEDLAVAPSIIRPVRSAHGAEDDLTKTYRTIQEHNTNAQKDIIPNLTLALIRTTENMHWTATVAKKKMIRVQGPMSTRLLRKKIPIIPECLNDFYLVQRAAACLWDSKYHKNLDAEYGRDPFSLKKRFAPGKRSKGRVRQSLLGKRGDYTIRAAATPNTDMDIDEVGTPLRAAMHVTWPEVVNSLNYNFLLKAVLNGQHKYPGCNYVERDGISYLPSANFGGLRFGDKVHRHLIKGDWVIVNRQPSLHRFAIMGYRVLISPDDTIDSHLSITTPLGLDFDGDEENIYVPQNLLERGEIAHLMSVRQNLMKDGKLMIGFVQHAVLGAYKLTQQTAGKKVLLTTEEITEYLLLGKNDECIRDVLYRWNAFNGEKDLTGREFMSMLLPTYIPNHEDDSGLTKAALNTCMGSTIESSGDMDFAADRIGFLTRILENFCSNCGISIHLDDCMVPPPPQEIQEEADDILRDACDFAQELDDSRNGIIPSGGIHLDEEEAEENVCTLTGLYRDVLGKYAVGKIRNNPESKGCGMDDIVSSRAKGTEINISQNIINVGQQMSENSLRYKDSTSHYYRNILARYGFVAHSFIDGLTPTELFFHARASRIGLISTACQTSDAGYLYRKLFKSVEDERVCFDNSVRNAVGQIILFEYGFDTTFLHSIALRTICMTIQEVVDTFYTLPVPKDDEEDEEEEEEENEDNDPCSFEEVERLLMLREEVIEWERKLQVSIPVRFDKVFQGCGNPKCNRNVSYNAARNRVMQMWIDLTTNCHMMTSPAYELMFFEQMATRVLFERGVLRCVHVFKEYLEYVQETFATNICAAGSPGGMDAAQSITQPLTQTGLKRFHITGEKTTIVSGVTRLREIINLVKNIERPVMYVFLLPEFEDAFDPMVLVELRLSHVVSKYHDLPVRRPLASHLQNLPEDHLVRLHPALQSLEDIEREEHASVESCQLIHLSLYLNKTSMENRKLSPREVAGYLLHTHILQMDPDSVAITYAELCEDVWWITLTLVRTSAILANLGSTPDEIAFMPAPLLSLKLQHALKYDKQLLVGIEGIRDFALIDKEIMISDESADDKLVLVKRKCYLTMGSNLQAVCALPGIDLEYTTSNDIHQVFQVYGIDAAQLAIEENLMEAMQTSDASVAAQHIKLIAATMCFCGTPAALTFSGMTSKDTGSWFKRATFEQSLSSFIGAGISGHKDGLRGISEAIVTGTQISLGTGGDFRMVSIAPEHLVIPPQPTPKRFKYEVPDISKFLQRTSGALTEEAISLNLEPPSTNTETMTQGFRSYGGKRGNNTRNPDTKDASTNAKRLAQNSGYPFTYARKDVSQVLRPSSPRPQLKQSYYGSMQLLVPSSPKKRKKNERRKPRKGEIVKPLDADDETLTEHEMTHFFSRTAASLDVGRLTSSLDAKWYPSSP